MAKKVICFVLITLFDVNACQEMGNSATYPSISSCANETGVTTDQLQAARRERDVNLVSACFFRCFLDSYGLISQKHGKEMLDIPTALVLAKLYVPTITLLNLLPIAAELVDCDKEFEKEPESDDKPGCLKTKVLVNCLVRKKTLINAIRQAYLARIY